MDTPQLGEKIRFKPAGLTSFKEDGMLRVFDLPVEVTGTVVYVNPIHRTYRVEYFLNGGKFYETFKF